MRAKKREGGGECAGGKGRGGRGEGGWGGERHGEVSAVARRVLSAVGQLSALLSSLGFMSHTI